MSISSFDCMACYPKLCRCPQPKGSMCMVCTAADADCSRLDFKSMPVIEKHQDGTQVVKCTAFVRSASHDAGSL